MSELATIPVTALKGVGAALAEKLARVGLETLQDVLFHLPLRYQDRTRVVPIGALRPGQDAVIEGVVSGADIVMGRRRSLLVRLQDGSGTLSLRFYHFSQAQKEAMKRGTQLRCYGEARPGASGLEIYHPEYRALTGEPAPVEQTLTPIYPTTEGLTQQRLRNLSEQALARLGPHSLPDWLPAELARDYQLSALDAAIRYLHRPPGRCRSGGTRRRSALGAASPGVRGAADPPAVAAAPARAGARAAGAGAAAGAEAAAALSRQPRFRAHRRAAACRCRDRL